MSAKLEAEAIGHADGVVGRVKRSEYSEGGRLLRYRADYEYGYSRGGARRRKRSLHGSRRSA